jgi:hypothetical protein
VAEGKTEGMFEAVTEGDQDGCLETDGAEDGNGVVGDEEPMIGDCVGTSVTITGLDGEIVPGATVVEFDPPKESFESSSEPFCDKADDDLLNPSKLEPRNPMTTNTTPAATNRTARTDRMITTFRHLDQETRLGRSAASRSCSSLRWPAGGNMATRTSFAGLPVGRRAL